MLVEYFVQRYANRAGKNDLIDRQEDTSTRCKPTTGQATFASCRM